MRHINLSKNLISSWETIIAIASQVQNLETLNIRYKYSYLGFSSFGVGIKTKRLRIQLLNVIGYSSF